MYNAHHRAGVCGGERVNKAGAVCGLCWISMAEKNSFSQEGRAELAAIRAKFTDNLNHFLPHVFFNAFDLTQLQN